MAGSDPGDAGGRGPARTFAEVELPPPHPFWLAVVASVAGLALPAASAIAVATILGAPRLPHASGAVIAAAALFTMVEALLAGLGVGALVEALWRRWGLPGLGPANFLPLRWARHRWAHRQAGNLLKRLASTPPGPSAMPMISQLAASVARMNVYRQTHPGRASRLAAEVGRDVGLSPQECEVARLATLVNDIGTLDIAPGLLDRPGPIDATETDAIHQHSRSGADLVAPYAGDDVAAVVRRHGAESGAVPSLPPDPRLGTIGGVVSVVVAYDAILSDRAYRGGHSKARALAELQVASGIHLDPAVVAVLVDLERRRRSLPALPAWSWPGNALRRIEHATHVSVEPGAAAVTAMVMGGLAWLGVSWTGAMQLGPTAVAHEVITRSEHTAPLVNEANPSPSAQRPAGGRPSSRSAGIPALGAGHGGLVLPAQPTGSRSAPSGAASSITPGRKGSIGLVPGASSPPARPPVGSLGSPTPLSPHPSPSATPRPAPSPSQPARAAPSLPKPTPSPNRTTHPAPSPTPTPAPPASPQPAPTPAPAPQPTPAPAPQPTPAPAPQPTPAPSSPHPGKPRKP